MTGFYMMTTFVFNELKNMFIFDPVTIKFVEYDKLSRNRGMVVRS